jgi:hypothetical protein
MSSLSLRVQEPRSQRVTVTEDSVVGSWQGERLTRECEGEYETRERSFQEEGYRHARRTN